MKTNTIPFLATLGCTLTACIDKELLEDESEDTNVDPEDTDTEDTDTDDTGEVENDISDIVGIWTVEYFSETYDGYTETYDFPVSYTYYQEGYGVTWTEIEELEVFFDIAETGGVYIVQTYTETEIFTIDGTEIYSLTYGYSYFNEYSYSSISSSEDGYLLELDERELNCTLTGGSLSCEGDDAALELTEGGEILDDFVTVTENWPAAPEYTKEDCVDAEITSTGDALEWGGFNNNDNDIGLSCIDPTQYSPHYGYYYAEDMDDFVFSFEAPNDGCFAFDTTGTTFHHAIQLSDDCNGPASFLSCSMTQHVEHQMEAGQVVLVAIDGAADDDQVFNLSINEVQIDTNFDAFSETTLNITTSEWTEELEIDCGYLGYAKTFLWTAPSTGQAVLNTAGSDFDTIVQIEEAGCNGSATTVCNDDGTEEGGSYGVYTSFLRTNVVEGHQYKITIGGAFGDSGTLSMTLQVQ